MRVLLERFGLGRGSTLGELSIDGEHVCYTLEDERRRAKVWGETAIPEGVYELRLRPWGGKHATYSDRFPGIHRGMIEVVGVPGFKHILFHIGNWEHETDGCILPGLVPGVDEHGEFEVLRSKAAYLQLYPRIAEALAGGQDVQLEVRVRRAL